MIDSPIIMEEVTDLAVIARARAQDERFKRTSDWLQAHRADLLPQVRGKHLAVAGQEAVIADTLKEAWAMAKTAHPDDNGALCQYVYPNVWPRFYLPHWRVAGV
jgi:hypothetical protein